MDDEDDDDEEKRPERGARQQVSPCEDNQSTEPNHDAFRRPEGNCSLLRVQTSDQQWIGKSASVQKRSRVACARPSYHRPPPPVVPRNQRPLLLVTGTAKRSHRLATTNTSPTIRLARPLLCLCLREFPLLRLITISLTIVHQSSRAFSTIADRHFLPVPRTVCAFGESHRSYQPQQEQ